MEDSEKTNGKKRLPSIPPNYVTLLQLQERWNKEKERKQKEKEEKEKPQQPQREEKETNVEERVNDEDSGRVSRKNGRFPRVRRDNGKRVAEGKPRDKKTAVAEDKKPRDEIAAAAEDKKPRDEITTAAEDFDNEEKGEESKKKKKKKKKKRKDERRNEMEDKDRAANEGEEVTGLTGNAALIASTEHGKGEEELIGEEVHAPKLMSGKEKNVKGRRESRPSLFRRTHGRSADVERQFQEVEHNKGEEELIGDEVHAPKLASVEKENVKARREWRPSSIPRTHGLLAEIGQKFPVMEHNREEKPIGDELHAPKLAGFEEENDDVRRESQPRSTPRTHGLTAEIGRKFQAMSVNDEIRTGRNRRYDRQNFNFNHRGDNPERKRRDYGKFDRRRELNQSNRGMVWVRKGEVEDQNVSGVQSSSC